MTSKDLSTAQMRQPSRLVGPFLGLLSHLCRRLDKRGFDPNDELYRTANAATNTVGALSVTLHYGSCESGVCREPGKRDEGGLRNRTI